MNNKGKKLPGQAWRAHHLLLRSLPSTRSRSFPASVCLRRRCCSRRSPCDESSSRSCLLKDFSHKELLTNFLGLKNLGFFNGWHTIVESRHIFVKSSSCNSEKELKCKVTFFRITCPIPAIKHFLLTPHWTV